MSASLTERHLIQNVASLVGCVCQASLYWLGQQDYGKNALLFIRVDKPIRASLTVVYCPIRGHCLRRFRMLTEYPSILCSHCHDSPFLSYFIAVRFLCCKVLAGVNNNGHPPSFFLYCIASLDMCTSALCISWARLPCNLSGPNSCSAVVQVTLPQCKLCHGLLWAH